MMASVWKKGLLSIALAAVLAFSIGSVASADPMTITDPGIPGNTQADAWTNPSLIASGNPGYGGFPGSGAWPAPIESPTSNVGNDGDGQLHRLAGGAAGGGPFPAAGSLYFGSFNQAPNLMGGTLAVRDATPLSGLQNIVFQIQIGEAEGFDFFNEVLPVLNYNGGSQGLAATNAVLLEAFDTGETFPAPGGDQPILTNTYLLQWDVSALGAMNALSIEFSGVSHSQVYQMRLDQSDVFVNVPEPGTFILAGLAMAGVVGIVWKKRRAA